jgi:hypothetical protein
MAERFARMAPGFEHGGEPLYAYFCREMAAACWHDDDEIRMVLDPFQERQDLTFPQCLLAGIHRLVLMGQEPVLATFYRSMDGHEPATSRAWSAFREAIVRRGLAGELPGLVAAWNQHNEAGRAAPLSVGLLHVARLFGLPLRTVEIGASAGILSFWDRLMAEPRFRHQFAEPDDAPEALQPPPLIAERLACDLEPFDVRDRNDQLTLRSWVWPSLWDRLGPLLEAGLHVASQRGFHVDKADGADYLTRHLASPYQGATTVVFHTMIEVSCPPESMTGMVEQIMAAGASATTDAPFAYVRLTAEPTEEGAAPLFKVECTSWPGDLHQFLATCDVNGSGVVRNLFQSKFSTI